MHAARMHAKLQYIRYLKQRRADPAPLLSEIERHKRAIAEHERRVQELEWDLAHLDEVIAHEEQELQRRVEYERQEIQESLDAGISSVEQWKAVADRLAALEKVVNEHAQDD